MVLMTPARQNRGFDREIVGVVDGGDSKVFDAVLHSDHNLINLLAFASLFFKSYVIFSHSSFELLLMWLIRRKFVEE